MAEVTLRKKDALDRRQIRSNEERVTEVTTFPTQKVPYVLRNNIHGFVTLLFHQFRSFDLMLEYRTVLTRKATHVCAKGLRPRLILSRYVQDLLYFHQDLFHAVVCDFGFRDLSRVNAVRLLWYRSRQRCRSRIRKEIHGDIALDIVNGLVTLAMSGQRRSLN